MILWNSQRLKLQTHKLTKCITIIKFALTLDDGTTLVSNYVTTTTDNYNANLAHKTQHGQSPDQMNSLTPTSNYSWQSIYFVNMPQSKLNNSICYHLTQALDYQCLKIKNLQAIPPWLIFPKISKQISEICNFSTFSTWLLPLDTHHLFTSQYLCVSEQLEVEFGREAANERLTQDVILLTMLLVLFFHRCSQLRLFASLTLHLWLPLLLLRRHHLTVNTWNKLIQRSSHNISSTLKWNAQFNNRKCLKITPKSKDTNVMQSTYDGHIATRILKSLQHDQTGEIIETMVFYKQENRQLHLSRGWKIDLQDSQKTPND